LFELFDELRLRWWFA